VPFLGLRIWQSLREGGVKMATKAYILIEAQVGKVRQVVETIRKSEGVVSVDSVTGPYDIVAIVEGETTEDIGALLTTKVHRIDGISRTVTCLAVQIS